MASFSIKDADLKDPSQIQQLMAAFQAQNEKLQAQVLQLAQQNARLIKNQSQSPKRKSPKRKSPPLRRSPRHHSHGSTKKKKRKSPKGMHTPKVKKRLSFQRKPRTPSSPDSKLVRQTLGETIKARYDDHIIKGSFIEEGVFNRDLYEDAVRPIIEAMIADAEIPTGKHNFNTMFTMALDIAKKRRSYKNNHPDKASKSPAMSASKAKRALTAKVAAICAITQDNVVDLLASDESAHEAEAEATVEKVDSEAEEKKFTAYDSACQLARKDLKQHMMGKKAEVAKDKAAKAAKAAAEKDQAAKAKATKAAKTKATKAAKAKATKAAKAAAKAKGKTNAKPKSRLGGALGRHAEKFRENERRKAKASTSLKVGMKVSAPWNGKGPEKGNWFDGVIVSLDYDNRTAHIHFEDGDVDDAVPWTQCSMLDDITSDDDDVSCG